MHNRRERMRQEYVARINRVMDYIGANLNGDLCLEKLAGVANFSPYHFHRVFRGMTGELSTPSFDGSVPRPRR